MADSSLPFAETFEALTGHRPFPWQERLFHDWFAEGKVPPSCNLPTGLGKTNVIAVWLIALARGVEVPRRLVYVVNRRTVVDQTTAEVERIRDRIGTAGIAKTLRQVCGLNADEPPLALSTLRGQFADNHEWSANPSCPAVICGTVDMIGSRLLFSGYGIGFRSRPLHAGLLGQDALLVHDEAHLEPAFQKLIATIEQEQTRCRDFRPLRIMELTATTRTSNGAFTLDRDDHEDSTIAKRINAKKILKLHMQADPKGLANQIADLAMQHKDSGTAVLVFVRHVEDVIRIRDKLEKAQLQVEILTGTLRGKERDELVEKPVFQRFLPPSNRSVSIDLPKETVYLVCTSAGEVGVNISADHMICDLSTFESMAQRFGRVNRFGERDDTRIDVVYPTAFDEKDKLTPARQATLELLKRLDGDASPQALSTLNAEQRKAAFAPEPTILSATDILFDAWALTTIREKMPGRPPVEPYLHGIAEWEPPETYVAWREEVEVITGQLLEQYPPADLLDDYPLKPHELLHDRSDRVFTHLESLSKRLADRPVWILDDEGAVEVTSLERLVKTLGQLNARERDRHLNGCTILLPPSAGGLKGGMLDGTSEQADDVSDVASSQAGTRIRVWADDPEYENKVAEMRRVCIIEIDKSEDEDGEPRRWEWYESVRLEGGRTAKKPVRLDTHVNDVTVHAGQIVAGLRLPQDIDDAIVVAASLHDCGKRRGQFQITLGNKNLDVPWAKSGRNGARLPEPFRHEFASVLDAQDDAEFDKLEGEMKELVLHLIAAHHGRARPHFYLGEEFDPGRPRDAEALAMETPRRFARLQRKYGRWGLAYLESLLRAADWTASAAPSKFVTETEEVSP